MNHTSGISGDQTSSPKKELNSELSLCTALAIGTGLTSLAVGAIGFPFIAKRYLQNYLGYEYRFLICSVSAIASSFCMAYRSKITCEESARKAYIKRMEKELKEQKKS